MNIDLMVGIVLLDFRHRHVVGRLRGEAKRPLGLKPIDLRFAGRLNCPANFIYS